MNTTLTASAAQNIAGFDRLLPGLNPHISKSSRENVKTIKIALVGGKVCEVAYGTEAVGWWKHLNLNHNKAQLFTNAGVVDTGKCPSLVTKQ
jgi:hypothetical protein